MKTFLLLTTAIVLAALPAAAANYTDATNDFNAGSWADITSVDVNNDATTLTFKINTAGSPDVVANTWHHYYVGISENLFGGVGGNLSTSPYGRNIQMSVGGLDYALLSYPAYSGYDRFTWSGSAWVSGSGAGLVSWDATGVTINVALADIGLPGGGSFTFDVWTSTSGSDTVLDALSDSVTRGYNSNPFDTGANALSYTAVVPEPSMAALLGLGALALLRRARAAKS